MFGKFTHRTKQFEAEDLHWRLTLHPVIERAEMQYRVRLDGGVPSLAHALKPGQVEAWLSGVTWETSFKAATREDRHGNLHASAHYDRQRIVFNVLHLRKMAEDPSWKRPLTDDHPMTRGEAQLLDLCLHELGHLATHHFFRTRGHNNDWRRIGRAVGYVEIGTTHDARRVNLIRSDVAHMWAASGSAPTRPVAAARLLTCACGARFARSEMNLFDAHQCPFKE